MAAVGHRASLASRFYEFAGSARPSRLPEAFAVTAYNMVMTHRVAVAERREPDRTRNVRIVLRSSPRRLDVGLQIAVDRSAIGADRSRCFLGESGHPRR
jgi:hypothetical protein